MIKKENLRKNKLQKIFLAMFFMLMVSCSSVGTRTVPNSKVVSRSDVVKAGMTEVSNKFGREIDEKNVGIYKKGFRNWKVILYDVDCYYQVFVTEDGKVVSSEKLDYK